MEKSILIIEDNPSNLKLAKICLEKVGYKVLTSVTAEEGLELLKDKKPDMILMDLQLPRMDGLQLTSLLKKNPNTRDIIIIALTAYAMEGDELKALMALSQSALIRARWLPPSKNFLMRNKHSAYFFAIFHVYLISALFKITFCK
jgi:two-component system cell cycle response regulator DivK